MGNKFATSVMVILIYRSANIDKFIYPEDGPPILLKKGQCFCGRFELAKWFGLNQNQSGKIQRILDFLQNSAKLISKQRSRNGSIISILNYDSLTQFDQTNDQVTDKPQTNHDQTVDTNKSDKSDKSDKSIKKKTSPGNETSSLPVKGDLKIIYNLETKHFDNITDALITQWQEAFPAVDVLSEIKKAEVWVDSNPKNRKSNWKRFISSWLTRTQDKARPLLSGGGQQNLIPNTAMGSLMLKVQQEEQGKLNK